MDDFRLDFNEVNKSMGVNLEKKTYRNERRKTVHLLPFPTRNPERVLFDNGFMPIIAGALRKLNGFPIESTGGVKYAEDIMARGKYKDNKAEAMFSHFLKNQLNQIEQGEIYDLSQITSIPMSERKPERVGEKELIHYVHDTFLVNHREEILDGLNFKTSDNIILQLLIPEKETASKISMPIYRTHFKKLEQQFKADFLLLLKHPKFLLENIDLFFAHYTFISTSQLILQVSRYQQFDEDNWIKIYFLYHEEKAARWREAYKHGYQLLRTSMLNFYVHEHLINIVSQVPFIKKENVLYHEIYQTVKEYGSEAESAYLDSLHDWMETYFIEVNESNYTYIRHNNIPDTWKEMAKFIRPNIDKAMNSRFTLAFDSLFSKYYYKHGGSLGKLTGISQRQILLLVALSVGEERLELNKLWDAFEKRGVYLDYQTREIIVETLDRLNYIEKQSDSGDAQYVKPVL